MPMRCTRDLQRPKSAPQICVTTSCFPADSAVSRAPAADCLAALKALFRRRNIRWYLFGAHAAILFGRPRFTEDLDVTIEIDEPQLTSLLAALKRAHFRSRVEDPIAFTSRTRVMPVFHEPTSVPVDIVIAGDGLEREFLERVVEAAFGRLKIPVLSPTDLIISKMIAGRPKDLDDVTGILSARAKKWPIDVARIEQTLTEVDAALGDSDCLAQFRKLRKAIVPG